MQLTTSKAHGETQLQAIAEVNDSKTEAMRSKGTCMLAALASGSSLNLNQELIVRDCCFKWKQGKIQMHIPTGLACQLKPAITAVAHVDVVFGVYE